MELPKFTPKEVQIAINVVSALGLLAIAFGAFSRGQRDAIALDRDEGHCQAPFEHDCNEDRLEVHHIMPQRYAKHFKIDEENIDTPENAISLCKPAHMMIHPDMTKALRDYHKMKAEGINSFEVLGEERQEKLNQHEIYWNDKHDRKMRMVALKRTQESKKRGWAFPTKRKKK